MAGLIYYVPGETRGDALAALKAAGIGYAFDGEPTTCECSSGPDRVAGMTFGAGRIGYYPDKQTWRKIPGSKAWVGRYDDDPPTPAELARPSVLTGHFVKLADGNEWLVPVARGLTEEVDELRWVQSLPQTTTLDDSGAWVTGGVEDRYAGLWNIAEAWWTELTGALKDAAEDAGEGATDVTAKFDFQGINDSALTALATNYRTGKAEVALLGLFNDRCVTDILNALVDWPTFLAWNKKKQDKPSGGLNTDDGQSAETNATAPP